MEAQQFSSSELPLWEFASCELQLNQYVSCELWDYHQALSRELYLSTLF